jgi:hypothetical protein
MEIDMRILNFNAQATAAIQGRTGGKLRLDVKDGTLMVRPTDRKAGPHVLTEIVTSGKTAKVEITDKQLEKLGVAAELANASTFGLRSDKYGWFAMTTGEAAEGDTTVIEGAEVAVSDAAE